LTKKRKTNKHLYSIAKGSLTYDNCFDIAAIGERLAFLGSWADNKFGF